MFVILCVPISPQWCSIAASSRPSHHGREADGETTSKGQVTPAEQAATRPPPLRQQREHSSTTLRAQAGLHKVAMTYLGSLSCFLARGSV
jgi:hypothetical protein